MVTKFWAQSVEIREISVSTGRFFFPPEIQVSNLRWAIDEPEKLIPRASFCTISGLALFARGLLFAAC